MRVVISEVMDWIKIVGIGVFGRFGFDFDFRDRDLGSGKKLHAWDRLNLLCSNQAW